MCGTGTIAEVVAVGFPHCFVLAGDRDIGHIKLPDVVQWDPRRLPLRSDVLDKLVTNLIQLGPSLGVGPAGGKKNKNQGSPSDLVSCTPTLEDVYPLVSRSFNTKADH